MRRIDVVVKAPSAKALFGSPQAYFDPERPWLSPEECEREARRHPHDVQYECPICHVVAVDERAFWLHAQPCLERWWSTLSIDRRYAGASLKDAR
jgi:hypothetical protein